MSDPRDPHTTAPFEIKINKEELPPDWAAMASLILGLVAMVTRAKWSAWGATFASLASLGHANKQEMDVMQMVASTVFAIVGLGVCYSGAPSMFG